MAASLRALFPRDLPADRAVYIVNTFDVPEGFRDPLWLLTAYTGCCIDIELQPHLERLGLWQGRGFVVVLPCVGFFFDRPEADQFACIAHELSHHIEDLTVWHRAPEILRQLGEFPAADVRAAEQAIKAREHPPWRHHEARFIRAACHVRYRAALEGLPIGLHSMAVAGERYGLSSPWQYSAAIGNELRDRCGEAISDILDSPQPATFAALWQSDTAAWPHATNPPSSP